MPWRRHRSGEKHSVTLYAKEGCHLCDDARKLLHRLALRFPLLIEEVDIRHDPATFRRYDIRIPVIVVDGEIELEAPIDERALIRALRR